MGLAVLLKDGFAKCAVVHIEITSFRALDYKMLAVLYTDEKSRNLEKYIYIGTLFNFFIFILGSCYVDIVGLRLNV